MCQFLGLQVSTDVCCPCYSHLCKRNLGLRSYLARVSWNVWQCKPTSHALLRGTSDGAGTYRLRHFGDYKHIFGGPVPFNGTSSSFEVCIPTGLLYLWAGCSSNACVWHVQHSAVHWEATCHVCTGGLHAVCLTALSAAGAWRGCQATAAQAPQQRQP